MFEESISITELTTLCNTLSKFSFDNPTFENACEFIKANPYLLKYKKNQVGEGEFALFLLIPTAFKTVQTDKNDLNINGKYYEIKRILRRNDTIRFGTNINIKPINNLRYLTFGLSYFFSEENIVNDCQLTSARDEYVQILNGSDASITIPKMNKMFTFFQKVVNDSRQLLLTDANTLKAYYQFVELIKTFLNKYGSTEAFGKEVVTEIYNTYNAHNTNILIIDQDNNFLVNPTFVYHSVNQYVRPQVVLV